MTTEIITSNVKIVSDGTSEGTKVTVDGVSMTGVSSVVVDEIVPGELVTAKLTVFCGLDLNLLEGKTEILTNDSEDDIFLEWLAGADIYTGYCRYGQINGHGFLCASSYDENEDLETAVDNLDGGDLEALDAGKYIEDSDYWYSSNKCPSKAMADLVRQMRNYYYELNGYKTR